MDFITTPTQTGYSPPANSIVHNTAVSLTDRAPSEPVHIVQYDMTMPIIAVKLQSNGRPYTVPDGAAVNFRMDKPDGTHVYNPALGIASDGQTVYIGVTQQTAAAAGETAPIVEVVVNGARSGSGAFNLIIDPSPVPENAIESQDEYLTMLQILTQVQQAAQIVSDNSAAINTVSDNLPALNTAAQNISAINEVANISENVTTVAKNAQQMQQVVDNLPDVQNAAENAAAAAASATQAESWAVGGTGERTGEDTNNAKFWSEQAAQAANGYLGYFATQAALQSAHPTANAGAWATVGETKTVWFWDGTQFVNSTPGATSSSAGIVTLQNAPNAAQTAANGYAASPAALLYDAPKQYGFVTGTTVLSIASSTVTRGIIVTVRYGGNIDLEVTIAIPKDSAFDGSTHRYYTALYFNTWRFIRVAINNGNLVLEYVGDGSSVDDTSTSAIKAEAF